MGLLSLTARARRAIRLGQWRLEYSSALSDAGGRRGRKEPLHSYDPKNSRGSGREPVGRKAKAWRRRGLLRPGRPLSAQLRLRGGGGWRFMQLANLRFASTGHLEEVL